MKKNGTKTLAVCLLSIAGLVACSQPSTPTGSSSAETSSAGTSSAETAVTIEWWVPAKASDPTSCVSYTYAKKIADAYHAAHPLITVNVVAKGTKNNDYTKCASAVSDSLTGGNTPNMVTTYGTYVAAWRKAAPAAVADVTALGQQLEGDTDFVQNYLSVEKAQYGGTAYYSLPYSKSGEFLQYNVEVFAAVGAQKAGAETSDYPAPTSAATKTAYTVPTTFPEMMELARKIKADYPGISWGRDATTKLFNAVPVIYESAVNLWVTALESAGITMMDVSKTGVNSVPFLNDDKAKAVAVQLKKWANEGLFCTSNQLPTDAQGYHAYPSTMVNTGKSMVMITSTANAPWDAADGYSIGFSRVPKWNSEANYRTLSQGASVAFFNHADTNELTAAKAFYTYLTSGENSAELALDNAYYPVRKSSYEVEGIKGATEAAKGAITYSSTTAEKKSAYLGKSFNINDSIATSSEYFMSPVSDLSAKVRTGISGIVDGLLNDTEATTDEQINALVEDRFTAAKQTIFA